MTHHVSRRTAVTLAAAAALPHGAARAAETGPSLRGPYLDLTTGDGNMLAMARIHGDIDTTKIKHSWYTGRLMGVVAGEAVRDLVGIRGMGTSRLMKLPDRPGYAALRREVGFYVDLETGKIIDTWRNPYTNETVEVFHIANDPVNATYEPVAKGAALYDDPVAKAAGPKPYLLDWQLAGDRLFVEQKTHLWAKNPLDPKVWARESAGPMIQVSDMMTFNVSLADMQNPKLTTLKSQGTWVHVRPWQPWMLMGQAPGHCLYNCFTGSAATLDEVPADIVAATRERFPAFLTAPTELKPSVPSLQRYMRDRKPAPPRASGATP
jgi:hypothetical protein